MNKCGYCEKEYEAKRSTSRFCSAKCKQAFYRNKVNVTTDPFDVTVNEQERDECSADKFPVKVELDKIGAAEPDVQISTAPDIVNFGQFDCECLHCHTGRINHSKNILNHGPYEKAGELKPNELNRVSLPGDWDYEGVCKVG